MVALLNESYSAFSFTIENKNKVDLFQTLLRKRFLKKKKRRINADNENYVYKLMECCAKNPESLRGLQIYCMIRRVIILCIFLFFIKKKTNKQTNKQRIAKFINPLVSFICKVDIKNHPNPKKIDDIEMNKKIYCKNCGEDWGVTALISGVEWLCIKICSFVLEFPGKDQPRRMYKKWKDLPFGIKEASMEEILKHSGEKGPGDDLLDINFDD